MRELSSRGHHMDIRIEERSGAAAGALVVPAPAARASVGMNAMLAASVIHMH